MRPPGLRSRALLALWLACAAAIVAPGLPLAGAQQAVPPPPVDPRGTDPASPNPLAGLRLYVDKRRHPAWRQYRSYRRKRRSWAEGMMWKVAREPKFQWFGRWNRRPRVAVKKFLRRAREEQRGAAPMLTVLRHQGRGCGGGYDGGGGREDARTRKWYRGFARGIGRSRVVIAFEPDSLGTVDCLKKSRRAARVRTLAYGVDVLSRLRSATVYIEAGASDWEGAGRTAKLLRKVGIGKVRGFMLNVTHYDWTLNNIRHGLRISRLTGGKPFIINTASNGRGPVHYRKRVGRRRIRRNVWCHPLKRGLGIPPTTATHDPKVDAYLWISRPGYSSGACNGGPLPVGSWWPERALMFAKHATTWIRRPSGTRHGHHRRYTLKQLGA